MISKMIGLINIFITRCGQNTRESKINSNFQGCLYRSLASKQDPEHCAQGWPEGIPPQVLWITWLYFTFCNDSNHWCFPMVSMFPYLLKQHEGFANASPCYGRSLIVDLLTWLTFEKCDVMPKTTPLNALFLQDWGEQEDLQDGRWLQDEGRQAGQEQRCHRVSGLWLHIILLIFVWW